MLIKKKNPFTGKESEMEIPVTPEQLQAWEGGELIQRAMPNLNADQREFIRSGLLPQEFDDLHKDVD